MDLLLLPWLVRPSSHRPTYLSSRMCPPSLSPAGGSGGPLGLKLRKSNSLLNLINSSLSSDAGPSCQGHMGLAPMLC